jgi:hypothetical protein
MDPKSRFIGEVIAGDQRFTVDQCNGKAGRIIGRFEHTFGKTGQIKDGVVRCSTIGQGKRKGFIFLDVSFMKSNQMQALGHIRRNGNERSC